MGNDTTVVTVITGLVTIVTTICGVVTLWIKLRENNQKIEVNTELTKAGTTAAVISAKVAASAAHSADDKLNNLLNGALRGLITDIVKDHTDPIVMALKEHAEQDDTNMKGIHQALLALKVNNK